MASVCGDLTLNEIDFPLPIRSRPILVTPDAEAFSRLFREGETIAGKVIGRIDARHVVLRLQGQNLLVETDVSLVEHEEKTFQIEATAPRVILRLLADRAENRSPEDWLKRVISHDVPGDELVENLSGLWKIDPGAVPSGLREAVRSFVELLHSFSLKDISQTPDSLREAMSRSGLFLEHKMRQWIEGEPNETVASLFKGDLKGSLLKLRPELNSAAAPQGSQDSGVHDGDRLTVEQLGKGVEQLIQKLELVQLLNAVQSDPQEKIFMFLPLWFENQPHFLDLSISLPRRGSRGCETESCSILFLLHMPQWGRLAIEVVMRGKNLTCQFRVGDPEVSKFIDPLLPGLQTRLDSLGFQSVLHVSKEPLTESLGQGTSSLISELGEEVTSLVSIVV